MGYDEQEPLLKATYDLIPKGIKIILAADRFYGTAALIIFVPTVWMAVPDKIKK